MQEHGNRKRTIQRAFLFVLVGIGLFAGLQHIFVPKWYYPDKDLPESPTRTVTGFYEEPENSLDVISIGASSVLYGYSPMYVYEKYGIKSYNLATSEQPMEVSYFAVKEALKKQTPKVILLDVSTLFYSECDYARWRYFLDNIPYSFNKLQMAKEFSKRYEGESFSGALFPFLRYHDRWEGLMERDFTDFFRDRKSCERGYYLNVGQNAAGTVEDMQDYADLRGQVKTRETEGYEEGKYFSKKEDSLLYAPSIVPEKMEWLLKIKKLCDDRGIALVTVKIPANYFPQGWSWQKHQETEKVMAQQGIAYYDLMYDYDTGINWNVDTRDGGGHLNVLGALKASDMIGGFLADDYGLKPSRDARWDADADRYNAICEMAMLELDNDFVSYLGRLSHGCRDKTILIAASDDFYNHLSERDKEALEGLGLQTEFEDAFRKSFVAVIENGAVRYEALSNRTLVYTGVTGCGTGINLISSGWLEGSNAQILINSTQYALNGRGFNIVLYDDVNDMVLDSAVFDTSAPEHTGRHSTQCENVYLNLYKSYIYSLKDS